jgi:hypothetical protein
LYWINRASKKCCYQIFAKGAVGVTTSTKVFRLERPPELLSKTEVNRGTEAALPYCFCINQLGDQDESRVAAIGDPDSIRKTSHDENLALVASIMTLIAISGQAFADTAPKNAQNSPEATSSSDRQVVDVFNAFDPANATQTTEPNAYRYHGGPKSND